MAFKAFLRHIGAPAVQYLRNNRLPALCDEPDMHVPLNRVWSLFGYLERKQATNLGWEVGKHIGDHNLNAGLLEKLENAPTLLLALKGLIKMASAEASHVRLGLQIRGDDILVYTHYPDMKGVSGYHTSQAYQIGVILDLIRHFLGRSWVPNEIGIENHTAHGIPEDYLIGCQIRTQQQTGYVVIPQSCLYKKISPVHRNAASGHDPLLTKYFDYNDTLRAVLTPYLADGYPTARLAAELMGISERTLHRRLTSTGQSYGSLIDETRFSRAKFLLQESDAPMVEIARSLGFTQQGNFSRMFKRISGTSPDKFRKMLRQENPG